MSYVQTRPLAPLGFRIEELQPYPCLHFEAFAQDHPEGRVRQLPAQCLEDLVPRIRAVIFRQLLERVRLGRCEKSPELVFSDAMIRVRDVTLFKHAVAIHPDEVVRDMLLKSQLRWFISFSHAVRGLILCVRWRFRFECVQNLDQLINGCTRVSVCGCNMGIGGFFV